MNRRGFFESLCAGSAIALGGCGDGTPHGPGFIATYSNNIAHKTVEVTSVDLPSGRTEWGIPGLPASDDSNWRNRGATIGIAGDYRGIPAWVIFNWQLWPYPDRAASSSPTEREASRREYEFRKVALPTYCSHVSVGERIPGDAVQAVIDSRKAMKDGDLFPDKSFWFYFLWTDDGVKFRWELRSRFVHAPIRSGGDDLD